MRPFRRTREPGGQIMSITQLLHGGLNRAVSGTVWGLGEAGSRLYPLSSEAFSELPDYGWYFLSYTKKSHPGITLGVG